MARPLRTCLKKTVMYLLKFYLKNNKVGKIEDRLYKTFFACCATFRTEPIGLRRLIRKNKFQKTVKHHVAFNQTL